MAGLMSLYDKRLSALGFSHVKCNTARPREDIECLIPVIKQVVQKDNTSNDVSTLHKAAKILQKEYFNINHALTGSFSNPSHNKDESLPPSLKSFLHILSGGPNIDQPLPVSQKSKVITSIGQQIILNSVERRSTKPGSIPRHIRDRETPAELNFAMKLYLKSDSKSVINVLQQR